MNTPEELGLIELDWDHTYLLGWYDHSDRAYLTSWDNRGSNLEEIYVIVYGNVNGFNFPLWDAPVPNGATVFEVPKNKNHFDLARETGGFCAIAWRIPNVVKRMDKMVQFYLKH